MPSIKAGSPRTSRTQQLVPVTELTGGIDLRRSPTLMAPNRARTLKNWSLEEPGALITREGYTQASSAVLSTGRPQGGRRIYLKNTAFTLVAHGGAVYKPTDLWVWGASVYSTLTSTGLIEFPYDRDQVMVMDGFNRPRFSTNGSTWMLAGIDRPSSGPSLSSGSSGAMSSGEYAIAYTYKYRGLSIESNGSSESTITVSGSTGAIAATASPSTDPKVDAYVWYARHKTPDQESVLRKVSSGAASTFTFTSTQWTANDEIATNHNVPATGLRFAVSWKSRWWAPSGTIGNRLHFTELFLPQAWPSLFFIDLPFEKGDSITALQVLGDTLLVHGQSGIYLVVGQTSLDFEVRPSQGADTGAFGQRATARVEQAAIHASADGVASFDGASDRSLEHDITKAWRDLVENTGPSDVAPLAVLHDQQHHEVLVSVPRVYPTGSKGEWIVNLDRTRDNDGVPAWMTTDRDAAVYIHWDGNEPTAGDRGRLFFLPSTAAVAYEANVGASANSSNLVAEYEGPAISFGITRARVVGTHFEFEANDGSFSVELVTDGLSQGTQAINIGAGLAVYGTAVYGTDVYGGAARLQRYVQWPITAEGQTATVKAVYTGQARFRWFGYAHLIVPEGQARRVN